MNTLVTSMEEKNIVASQENQQPRKEILLRTTIDPTRFVELQ